MRLFFFFTLSALLLVVTCGSSPQAIYAQGESQDQQLIEEPPQQQTSSTNAPSTSRGGYRAESNEVVTKVGNPPQPSPGVRQKAPPANPDSLREDIIKQFGITMNGFDNQSLEWAWEKFWDVSHTKFIELVRGVTITKSGESRQVNNNNVLLQSLQPETLFKVVLIHELGHIIRWRTDSNIARLNTAISNEGYVTYYSANAPTCTGSDKFNEDYAEMIAYYLNPAAGSQTAKCSSGTNPYTNGSSPLHYAIAKDILGEY